MIAVTLSLGLILALLFLAKRFKNFCKLLKVPGPLFPKGIKGNLLELMANPRQVGPSLASKYGPLYRYLSFRINLNNILVTHARAYT